MSSLLAALVVLLPPTVATAGTKPTKPRRWQQVAHQLPASLRPGEIVSVPVTIANPGPAVWSTAAGDRLAYHWYDSTGKLYEYEGRRSEFGRDIQPGQQRQVLATLHAPTQPGTYYVQWAMVREHVGWYLPPVGADAAKLTVAVEVKGPPADWELLQVQLLDDVRAGEPATAKVSLRNHTSVAWDPRYGDRLSYHWRDEAGNIVEEGVRTPFPKPVLPGETIEFTANLRGPDRPGTYVLAWEPVREGVRWLGPAKNPVFQAVEVTPSRRHIAITQTAPIGQLTADETIEVPLKLHNTGQESWSSRLGDAISYRFTGDDGSVFEGVRTPLPTLLKPGAQATIVAKLRAPPTPGNYRLSWAMVREHVAWYAPETPAAQALEVGPHRLAATIVDVAWPSFIAVNGKAEVAVTVQNSGRETWTEDLGDRLAYHWLGEDGQAVVFDGHRTHLPHPVEPGQSITLNAEVVGPTQAGTFTLSFDMVREQVTWFADVGGSPARPQAAITVVWQSGLLQALFLCLTILGLAFLRRKPPMSTRGRLLVELIPAGWAGLATILLIHSFAELSSYSLWRGSALIAGSSAGLVALGTLCAPRKIRPWVAWLWACLGSTLVLADLIYMHFCGSIVPFQALSGAHQVGDISASVGAALGGTHVWLLPVPIAGLLLAIGLHKATTREPSPPAVARRRMWALGLAVAGLWSAPFCLRMVDIMTSDLGYRVYSEQRNVGRLGVFGAHVFDGLRTLRERTGRGSASPEEVEDIRAWFSAHTAAQSLPPELPAHERPGVSAGSNVLIIQVESMQGWVVGAEVDGQQVTPFLNRMRDQARYFPHYADLTAQGMTSDSEYATLHSQLPLAQGALAFLRADNEFYTLAHLLADHGYQTFSAHPYKRGFWNRALLHPRYGFQESWFRRELGEGLVVGWGLADGLFFDRVLPKLRELDAGEQPFFAFLVTLSVHHPYDSFPPSLVELDMGELEGTALGNYLHGMHYTDASLQALFATLQREGILDHTIVAVYGDHDSRLGHDPDLLKLAGIERWSPAVTPLLERVPAFLWVPSTAEPIRGPVDTVGGHIDLAPTILHYLGIAAPTVFFGQPLLPGNDSGIAVFADGSARGQGLFWLATGPGVPQQGMCLRDPDGSVQPRAACADLAARAEDMLRYSRRVLDHDLARVIDGKSTP